MLEHTRAFVTPVVEHWLERKIAHWTLKRERERERERESMYVCMRVYMYVTGMYVYMYLCMYVCIYVCVCVIYLPLWVLFLFNTL